MMISKLTFVGAAALACVLAVGSALSFGQLGHGNGRQEPATAAPDGNDPQAALTRSVGKLESGLDETARRNAEMKRELQGIRTNLEAIRAAARPTNVNAPVMQLAVSLKQAATPAVTRLADALKRHPSPRGSMGADRMQVYMMDLVDGGTTLIADEPNPGLTRCSDPRWSHDGSRIVFDAAPAGQEATAHLKSIEVREGRPTFADLGPGAFPTFSADDKKVAFLGFGSPPRDEAGVWIMEADGSGRRRAGEFGAPLWSPDGREFLINDFSDNVTQTIVMNLDNLTDGILAVEGRQIFSWPTWVGQGTLVSCLATNNEGDTIALLDVTKPTEARIIEVLWKRGPDLDVTPRWPLYSAETGRCIFIGVDPTNKRTFYSVKRGESGRAKRMEPDGQHDRRGGLTLSPNGRYLLFNANRPAPLS